MKRNVKKGPRISPIKEQGMLVSELGNRVTFTWPDGRSIRCHLRNLDGDVVLSVRSHPGAVVIWPNMTNEVDLIPARIK